MLFFRVKQTLAGILVGLVVAAGIFIVTADLAFGTGGLGDASHARTRGDLRYLHTALQMYYRLNGSAPTTKVGLEVAIAGPAAPRHADGKPYFDRLPVDGWGSAYVYRKADLAKAYELFSLGPDRVKSEDDIR